MKKAVAFILLIIYVSVSLSASPVPVVDTSTPKMIPPHAEETELISNIESLEIQSSEVKKYLRFGSLVGAVSGMAIVAFGINTLFTGVTNGPDIPAIHDGIAIVVSGSLLAAIFSFLHQSFSEKEKTP